jgi:hypothetical protein
MGAEPAYLPTLQAGCPDKKAAEMRKSLIRNNNITMT